MLVVPFDNVALDGRIFWLGEASSVLLTDDLNALGVAAITREQRRQAFDRLQVPPVAALTDATTIRIAQLVGAARLVVGSLQMENDQLVVHARSIALDTGRVQVNVTEQRADWRSVRDVRADHAAGSRRPRRRVPRKSRGCIRRCRPSRIS